jgi:hypothetical protein
MSRWPLSSCENLPDHANAELVFRPDLVEQLHRRYRSIPASSPFGGMLGPAGWAQFTVSKDAASQYRNHPLREFFSLFSPSSPGDNRKTAGLWLPSNKHQPQPNSAFCVSSEQRPASNQEKEHFMRSRLILQGAAVVVAGVSFAANGYAQGFAGHHHGNSAIRPCIAVMSSSQKADLKQIFSAEKQTLKTDRQNVVSAKQALTSAILSGSKDVSSQESALASAQQQLQKDQDSAAEQVCGQLSSTQLSAAQTLFNNLTTLHTNTRQQAKTYFEQAKSAAGTSTSQSQTSE